MSLSCVKLKFHGTDTDSAEVGVSVQLATHDNPRRLVRRLDRYARFSSRGLALARLSVRDARVHTCKRILYTISYRVHVYKIIHDKCIPKSVSRPWNSSLTTRQILMFAIRKGCGAMRNVLRRRDMRYKTQDNARHRNDTTHSV